MIEMKYLVKEGTEPEAGSRVVECKVCNRKFALPAGVGLMDTSETCEECAAAEAASDMKNEPSPELAKALGE